VDGKMRGRIAQGIGQVAQEHEVSVMTGGFNLDQ
jgi:hypothetical protein